MNRVKRALRFAVVVMAIGAGTTALAVEPASAHVGSWKKERNGCLYTGGVNSFDSFAYTKKHYGGCSGHAWLRVTFANGTSSGDLHDPAYVEVYGPIRSAWHKSQSGEGWGRSH